MTAPISLQQLETLQQSLRQEIKLQRQARNVSELFLTDDQFADALARRQAEALDFLDLTTSIDGGSFLSGIEMGLGQALGNQARFGYGYAQGEITRNYSYVESFIASVSSLFGRDVPPRVQAMLVVARSLLNDIFSTRQSLREDEVQNGLTLSTRSFTG
ncbi:MAG: hypothetical protein KC474_01415 [Cyanobacteria bacterium HKST-UBA04]|nr:hypothetical protein [Cyanobacteria bacterium HKST-UBA04]